MRLLGLFIFNFSFVKLGEVIERSNCGDPFFRSLAGILPEIRWMLTARPVLLNRWHLDKLRTPNWSNRNDTWFHYVSLWAPKMDTTDGFQNFFPQFDDFPHGRSWK